MSTTTPSAPSSRGILNEEPSEDDVDRVTERLRAGGWPVIEDVDTDNEVRDVS